MTSRVCSNRDVTLRGLSGTGSSGLQKRLMRTESDRETSQVQRINIPCLEVPLHEER